MVMGARPEVHTDRGVGVPARDRIVFLRVNVAKETETNDVLEAVHQHSEARTPLIQGRLACRRVVTNQDGDLTVSLHLRQFFLEPR